MKAEEVVEAEDMTAAIGMTAVIDMIAAIGIKKKACLKTVTAGYQTIRDRVTNYDSKSK
jgi:hypothetical protein